MRRVAMLWTTLTITLISLSGCCKPVPQRCIVPDTEKPDINNTKCNNSDYSCIASKALLNYEAMRKYADDLESSSKTCK